MLKYFINLFSAFRPQPMPMDLGAKHIYAFSDEVKRRLHKKIRERSDQPSRDTEALNKALNLMDSRMGTWMDRMVDPITHAAHATVEHEHLPFGVLNAWIAAQINEEPRAIHIDHDWGNIEKNFDQVLPDYDALLSTVRIEMALKIRVDLNIILHEETMRVISSLYPDNPEN